MNKCLCISILYNLLEMHKCLLLSVSVLLPFDVFMAKESSWPNYYFFFFIN